MPSDRQDSTLHFPAAGLDVSLALDRQPIRDTGDGAYAYSTPEGVNVASYEPVLDRVRGGSRAGIQKYLTMRVPGGVWIIQGLDVVVSMSAAATSN